MTAVAGQVIVITGGTGFLGHALAQHLSRKNQVVCIQRRPRPELEIPGVQYCYSDLNTLSADALPRRTDLFIHQAAILDNPFGREPPNQDLFDSNVRGTLRALDLAAAKGVSTFVYGSSGGVYRRQGQPLREGDPHGPTDFYELTKCLAEQLVQWYQGQFRTVLLRYFCPYGPRGSNPLLLFMVQQILAGKPISCGPDGSLFFNPIYIDDAVALTERACLLQEDAVLNVAGAEVTSMREVASILAQHLGRKAILDATGPSGASCIADMSLTFKKLDYVCRVPLHDGLARMVAGVSP